MKEMKLHFSDEEAARIERVVQASSANAITSLAKRAVLDYVRDADRWNDHAGEGFL